MRLSRTRQRTPSLQPTTFGGLNRSELMSRVGSVGNKTTEGRALRLLRLHHITGWRRRAKILGKPDFVWPKLRLALFIDGCFWHGHDCGRNLTPTRNARFWRDKIIGNQRRDRLVTSELRKRGWTVVRIWECQLARDQNRCLRRIAAALRRAARQVPGRGSFP
jgi:DNA mismatch endonuclease (patch repair protein)